MDRPRCRHCRNPIKDHQPVAGPAPDDRGYHLDCWSATEAVQEMAVVPDQREYERQIEAQGLAALLSPYVSGVLPEDSTRSAV